MIPFTLPPLSLSNKSGADGNVGGSQGKAGNFSGTLAINTGADGKVSATSAGSDKTMMYVGAALAALWIFRH